MPDSIADELYLELAGKSEAISIFIKKMPESKAALKSLSDIVQNMKIGSMHIHFAFIDPVDNTKIYARPDIEKNQFTQIGNLLSKE